MPGRIIRSAAEFRRLNESAKDVEEMGKRLMDDLDVVLYKEDHEEDHEEHQEDHEEHQEDHEEHQHLQFHHLQDPQERNLD